MIYFDGRSCSANLDIMYLREKEKEESESTAIKYNAFNYHQAD